MNGCIYTYVDIYTVAIYIYRYNFTSIYKLHVQIGLKKYSSMAWICDRYFQGSHGRSRLTISNSNQCMGHRFPKQKGDQVAEFGGNVGIYSKDKRGGSNKTLYDNILII